MGSDGIDWKVHYMVAFGGATSMVSTNGMSISCMNLVLGTCWTLVGNLDTMFDREMGHVRKGRGHAR